MKHSDFVHLHVHTQYSLLDGACLLPKLIKTAADYRMPALAMTDHGNMFGAIEFYQGCIDGGVKPIIGCEAYIATGSRHDKSASMGEETSYHFTLLAKDEAGYKNLMKLVSTAYLEGFYYKPRIDKEVLAQRSKGLIGLSGCLKGQFERCLLAKNTDSAVKTAAEFRDILGAENFYIEIMDNSLPEQKNINKTVVELARRLNIGVVATNDVHYLKKQDAYAHEALLCIQTQTTLDDPKRMRLGSDEFYFKSPDEMKALFKDLPEAITNTVEIANKCNVELDFKKTFLPHYKTPDGVARDKYLESIVTEGLEKRYKNIDEKLKQRVDLELSVINKSGYASYFLIAWDFVNYAKQHSIPVGPGRGCLLPDAKILMKDGRQVDIQNIKIGDYIISHTGRANIVKDLFIYDTMEDIVAIKAKMPAFELKLTDDHKLLAIRHKMCNVKSMKSTICKPTCRRYCKNKLWKDYRLEWIKSAKLQKNDFLVYPKQKITLKKKFHLFDLADFIHNKVNLKYDNKRIWYEIGSNKIVQKRINRFIRLDEKLARLLGYYVSEGWSRVKKREASIGFGFGKHEEAKGREVQNSLKKIFNLDSKIIIHKKRNSLQVIGYSKIVGEFFERLCDKYAENKKVPEEIFNGSQKIKIEFLIGLFLGDGSNKEEMRISYDSTSYNLVSQIKMLLTFLGIMSSIKVRTYSNSKWHDSYKLRISGKQLFYFNKIFRDFKANIKHQDFYRNDTFIDENYIYFPIQGISFQKYKGKVYDISVDRDKTYIANEVTVHNSAAGSVVSYALGITDIDPLKYDLIFERFLNPDRVSLPDIDIDFCYERRAEVINYVTQKYGKDNVAQIITFGTMQARAVVRDVGRVMNIPYIDCDKIAKLIPAELDITLDKALEIEPELERLYKTNLQIRQLIDTSKVLEGISRHASTHAAGVVISEKPLTEHIPLYKASDEEQITTGYPMGSLEKIGLLKMDFLGLRTLTVIDETVKLVKKTRGIDININDIPLDDKNTFQLFSKAETFGVFQLESGGMRDLLKKLCPTTFEDIIALLALYRPGPIGSGMLDDFIKRKHGHVNIVYDHPALEPILKETYGIIVYQEQVMRIASVLAGFSMSQADSLRRGMAKKHPEVMERTRINFVEGAVKKGVVRRIAERVFGLIEYFAGYGFNRSHSAAYAMISYRTAYLKANFPIEFMTALLTSERANTDKVVIYREEVERMGIKVLPPDVNESDMKFTVVGDDIRFGLSAVKNVGEGAIESIIAARGSLGKFSSLYNFCENIDARLVNKKVLESLIKCGAFDCFKLFRAQLLAILDKAMEMAGNIQRDRSKGQLSFFDNLGDRRSEFKNDFKDIPDMKEWPESQLLSFEKQMLGFYVTGHPLAKYEKALKTFSTFNTARLKEGTENQSISIGGIINRLKNTVTKKSNEKMAIMMLEDLDGSVEVLVFPSAYQNYGKYVRKDAIVFVKGRLSLREEHPKIVADEIIPLELAQEKYTTGVIIKLVTTGLEEETLYNLKDILAKYRGQTPVYLDFAESSGRRTTVELGRDYCIEPKEELVHDIEDIFGSDVVRFKV